LSTRVVVDQWHIILLILAARSHSRLAARYGSRPGR
jgi:hypothetical protein